MLHELATRKARNVNPRDTHLLPSWRNAQKRPVVGATPGGTCHDCVPFGDNVLNRFVDVGKGGADHAQEQFDTLCDQLHQQ